VCLRLVALREAAGRLDNDVDAEVAPGQVLGFRDRECLQLTAADGDRLCVGADLFG
jgi:hypothetical protein